MKQTITLLLADDERPTWLPLKPEVFRYYVQTAYSPFSTPELHPGELQYLDTASGQRRAST